MSIQNNKILTLYIPRFNKTAINLRPVGSLTRYRLSTCTAYFGILGKNKDRSNVYRDTFGQPAIPAQMVAIINYPPRGTQFLRRREISIGRRLWNRSIPKSLIDAFIFFLPCDGCDRFSLRVTVPYYSVVV